MSARGARRPAYAKALPSRMRSRLNLTASALNGVPSWNVTPWRSLSVQVFPSGDTRTSCASQGTSPFGVHRNRPSKICSPTMKL